MPLPVRLPARLPDPAASACEDGPSRLRQKHLNENSPYSMRVWAVLRPGRASLPEKRAVKQSVCEAKKSDWVRKIAVRQTGIYRTDYITKRWIFLNKRENLFCLSDKRGFFSGGEGGIRTLDTLLGYTRFPIVRARPDYATSPRRVMSFFMKFSFAIVNDIFQKVKRENHEV